MTHKHAPLRPALTAIAAVLAFSSTAAIAQVAQPEVQTAPPPVAAPPVAAPAAPPVATPVPSAIPGPVVAQPTVAQPTVAQPTAQAPARPAATRPAQSQTAPRQSAPRAEQARPVAREAAPAPVAEPAAPIAADTTAVTAPAPLPDTPGSPIVDAAPQAGDVTTTETGTDQAVVRDGSGDWIMLGGIGLLAIAGLGGAAYVLRSRPRRDDAVYEPEAIYAPEPEPAPRPIATRAAAPAPVAAAPIMAPVVPATTPAAGTVTSHAAPATAAASPAHSWASMTGFTPPAARPAPATPRGDRQTGYYEAMVDDGPTEENPFLTRRKRLVRAHYLDAQLRKGAQSPRSMPQSDEGGESAPARHPEFA